VDTTREFPQRRELGMGGLSDCLRDAAYWIEKREKAGGFHVLDVVARVLEMWGIVVYYESWEPPSDTMLAN